MLVLCITQRCMTMCVWQRVKQRRRERESEEREREERERCGSTDEGRDVCVCHFQVNRKTGTEEVRSRKRREDKGEMSGKRKEGDKS